MLTLEQTKFIVSEVEKEAIHYSHLSDDIVDHLCCDIEHEMEQGSGFEAAYERVQSRIGYKGLKQIQKDTLFLIDKTYRKMKTTMKISGFTGPALLGMGSLFKIFHWPGASILLVLGFFVLCFLFLPTAAYVMYKETKSYKNLFVYILGFIASLVFSLGVLFKVQHWPGASIMLTLSIVTGLVLFLPTLLFVKLRQTPSRSKTRVYIILYVAILIHFAGAFFKIMHWPGASIMILLGNSILFLFAVPMYLVNVSREKEFVTGKSLFVVFASIWIIISTNLVSIKSSGNVFRNYMAIDEQLIANAAMLDEFNQKFANKFEASQKGAFNDLRDSTVKINKYLESVKRDFVLSVNNEACTPGSTVISSRFLNEPFKRKGTFLFFIGKHHEGKYLQVRNEITKYLNQVQSFTGVDTCGLVEELRQEINHPDWKSQSFSRSNAFSLEYLTLLQQKILLIESAIQVSNEGEKFQPEKLATSTEADNSLFKGSNPRVSYYIY